LRESEPPATAIASVAAELRRTLIAIARMLTAGPIRYRGIKHYGGFYDRGLVIPQLHRPNPYSADAIVYLGERNMTETDHHRWQRVLTGPWELTSGPATTTPCFGNRTSRRWPQTFAKESSAPRAEISHYNTRRHHRAVGGRSPISRLSTAL
jgi:hypothetical protein